MLGSLAVDTVYPAAGFSRLSDSRVRWNEDSLKSLSEGNSFLKVKSGLSAGSRPEGLCVGQYWGHGQADYDIMMLCGGDLGVYVLPPGQKPPEHATLVYAPQGCPPAYTRLQVLQKDRVLRAIVKGSDKWFTGGPPISNYRIQQCVFSEGSRQWLHPQHTMEPLQPLGIKAISGPAGQHRSNMEFAYSLVSSGPHPAMSSYKGRTRKHWPSPALLDALTKQPMLLVMVGPKDAQDSYLMFRISWSALELILICSLFLWVKKGYVCFKYTVKSVLKSLRPKDSAREGRSRVGSYHLKTVFLRHLEEHPPEQEGSPFQLMLGLCQDLQHYLLMGCLPHYFLPECDLLRTVGLEERQNALKAVGKVIAGPLKTIIMSPTEPEHIYGPHHRPCDLIRHFMDVSSLPSCSKRCKSLRWLLCRLDDHREGLHRQQLERDGCDEVSGRPGLVRLADYLQ